MELVGIDGISLSELKLVEGDFVFGCAKIFNDIIMIDLHKYILHRFI